VSIFGGETPRRLKQWREYLAFCIEQREEEGEQKPTAEEGGRKEGTAKNCLDFYLVGIIWFFFIRNQRLTQKHTE
jgi:hypothetical protein